MAKTSGSAKYKLVIHGGAGTISKANTTPEKYAAYKQALAQALRAGHAVLQEGGEAMDAAVAAVSAMEGMCCPVVSMMVRNWCQRLSSVQLWEGCSVQCGRKGKPYNCERSHN